MSLQNSFWTPLALLLPAVAALNTLKVSGSNFVDSVTNERFEILGVAYVDGPDVSLVKLTS